MADRPLWATVRVRWAVPRTAGDRVWAMTTTLRLARPDDGPAIARIYAPYVLDTTVSLEVVPPAAEVMAERVATTLPRWPWLVVEDASDVLGYAYAGSHRTRDGYRWTVEVSAYLDVTAHRRGLGRGLYGSLLGLLTAQGHRQAMAGVGLPNAASVAFHEALGFRPAGRSTAVGRKFQAWQDVGWWQRPLGAGDTSDPREPRPLDRLDPAVVARLLG